MTAVRAESEMTERRSTQLPLVGALTVSLPQTGTAATPEAPDTPSTEPARPHEPPAPELPPRLIPVLLAEHQKLINQLRKQNEEFLEGARSQHETLLSQLAEKNEASQVATQKANEATGKGFKDSMQEALKNTDAQVSILKDDLAKTQAAVGHLESAIRAAQEETLRSSKLIDENRKYLDTTAKLFEQSLDLLQAMLRPTFWLLLSAMLTLLLLGGYTGWKQLRAAAGTPVWTPAPPSPAPPTPAPSSVPSKTSPRAR